MNFVENILSKLFSETDGESFLVEKIERKSHEKVNYFKWLKAKEYEALNKEFSLAYFKKTSRVWPCVNMQIFHSSEYNAVSICHNNHIPRKNFQFYFDYLKDCILRFGYSLSYSEREIIDHYRYVETIERYSLISPREFKLGGRWHQLYGDILIEYVLIDDKPHHIKLIANYQTDQILYCPPLEFDELIDKLFFKNDN